MSFTNDDQTRSGFPPDVNVLTNKKLPSLLQLQQRCEVILKRLDENEILQYQTSSMVDKDLTPKEFKRETSQRNRGHFPRYKGSSTRGNFMDFGEHDTWPSSLNLSDDSLDEDYEPEDWVYSNKKIKNEDDKNWTPTTGTVRNKKYKKLSKRCSTNISKEIMKCENKYSTEFSNSLMGSSLKCGIETTENQNTKLRNIKKLRRPSGSNVTEQVSEYCVKPAVQYSFPNKKQKIENSFKKDNHVVFCFGIKQTNTILKSLPELSTVPIPNPKSDCYIKPMTKYLFPNQETKMELPFEKENQLKFCYRNEQTRKIQKSLNGKTSPNEIIDEIILDSNNSSPTCTPEPENERPAMFRFGSEERKNIANSLNEITDEFALYCNNNYLACTPEISDSPAIYCFGNKATSNMSERTLSPNEILDEYVLHCNNTSTICTHEKCDSDNLFKANYHHMNAKTHFDCRYCNSFIELDAVTILAIADLDKNPKVFVEQSIEHAKKLYDKLQSAQPQGGEENSRMVDDKSMEGLKFAKSLLLRFGSFINASKCLIKAKTLLENDQEFRVIDHTS